MREYGVLSAEKRTLDDVLFEMEESGNSRAPVPTQRGNNESISQIKFASAVVFTFV